MPCMGDNTDATVTEREYCLAAAKKCVCQDRNNQYGEPEDSFKMIADFWSNYLGYPINTVDVAMMMALLKIARVAASKNRLGTADSYIDLAGYAACGAEAAKKLKTRIIMDRGGIINETA